MRNTLLKIFILLFVLIKCASIQAPTGGPKDELPPVLMATSPASGMVNVQQPFIKLYFSEPVQLQSLQKNMLVSPYTDLAISSKVKKNEVTITFLDSLQPNTTYSFEFGEGIVDLTEKNIAKDVKLSFSTGATIDTAYIAGTVTNLLTGKPVGGAYAALYPTDTDTSWITGTTPPLYYTRANDEGVFRLSNLKPDTYWLVGVTQTDNKINLSKEDELAGFISTPVTVETARVGLQLPLTTYNTVAPDGKRPSPKGLWNSASFNKALQSVKIDTASAPLFADIEGKDVRLFLIQQDTVPVLAVDSVYTVYTATDSLLQTVTDTFKILFDTLPPITPVRPSFSTALSKPAQQKIIPGKKYDYELSFSLPIQQYYLDSLTLTRNADTLTIDTTAIRLYNNNRSLYLGRYSLDSGSIAVKGTEGAFVSVLADSSAAFSESRSLLTEDENGILEAFVETDKTFVAIQLLNDKWLVEQELSAADLRIDEKTNKPYLRFNYVKPGDKYLRALIDTNGDSLWSKGNILLRQAAEPIVFYPDSVPVRANWEIKRDNIVFSF